MINTTTEIKKNANIVFFKVDEGIYEVVKDRKEKFSGRLYVSTMEVIDALNEFTDVAILTKNTLGMESVLHSTLTIETLQIDFSKLPNGGFVQIKSDPNITMCNSDAEDNKQ